MRTIVCLKVNIIILKPEINRRLLKMFLILLILFLRILNPEIPVISRSVFRVNLLFDINPNKCLSISCPTGFPNKCFSLLNSPNDIKLLLFHCVKYLLLYLNEKAGKISNNQNMLVFCCRILYH